MEIKFYEKIGVKHWKKFIMWIEAKLIPDCKYRNVFNYNLKSISITSAKRFKKMLIYNASIHFVVGVYCIYCIIKNILSSRVLAFSTPIYIILFFVNLYCVLLQRYNWIRINKVLKKKKLIDQRVNKKNNTEE